MFKTTPRSVLFSDNLIRKSIYRVRINEDGTIIPVEDNYTDEHKGVEMDEFGHAIDRPITGLQKDGHYHLIDAMINRALALARINGFGEDRVTRKDIEDIFGMLINHHNSKVIRREGLNSPNILPPVQHPDWRTTTVSDYIPNSLKSQFLPNRVDPSHPDRSIVHFYHPDTGELMTAHLPPLITAHRKKDDVAHSSADTSDFIDSPRNPLKNELALLESVGDQLEQRFGISDTGRGIFDGFNDFMGPYMSYAPGLETISSGQMTGVRSADHHHVRTGVLPPHVLQEVNKFREVPHEAAPEVAPAITRGHTGGLVLPHTYHIPQVSGRPTGEGSLTRTPAIINKLNEIINSDNPNITADDKAMAESIIRRQESDSFISGKPKTDESDAIPGLEDAPIMTMLFRAGKSYASAPARASMGGVPKLVQDAASNILGMPPEDAIDHIKSVRSNLGATKFGGGKGINNALHTLDALHQAVINHHHAEGHPDPIMAANESIREHGKGLQTDKHGDIPDYSQWFVSTMDKLHGHETHITSPLEMQNRALESFSRTASAPTDLSGFSATPAQSLMAEAPTPYVNPNDLLTSFETLQMMSAIKDDRIMKYVKKGYSLKSYNDIRSFATSVGLTSQDVYGIMATKGDWGVVAKQWNVSPLIVKATKVTFGGA